MACAWNSRHLSSIAWAHILWRVYNEPIQRPAASWLVVSIDRALHRYRRGQGFESCTCLNFFRHLLATAKVASITVMIFFHVKSQLVTLRNFTWSCETREGLAACSAKGIPSFLSYFKSPNIDAAPGFKPATSRTAVGTALQSYSRNWTILFFDWINFLWNALTPLTSFLGNLLTLRQVLF